MSIETGYMRFLNFCTLTATSTWSLLIQTKGNPLDVGYWLPRLWKINWKVAGQFAKAGMWPVSNKVTLMPPGSQENEIEVEVHETE